MSSTRRFALVALISLVTVFVSGRPSAAQTRGAKAPVKPAAPTAPVTTAPHTAPITRSERAVPYRVGERLSYDVSWSNYLTAGTLTLAVDAKKASYGSTAYYIIAEAQTTGLLAKLYTLYYKADTLIDAYNLLPQRGSLYSREGSDQRTKVTTFDHPNKKGLFEMQTASKMTKELALPALAQDMLSSVYVLRSIKPQTGDRLEIPVSDSGWLYKVTFIVGAAESVKKSDGTAVQALKVTLQAIDEKGKSVGNGFALWLANDATLAPVRMEGTLPVGHIVLSLK